MPIFHNSADTPQLAQQELPLYLPVLHSHSTPESMGTHHAGLQTCPTGGLSIRAFFSPEMVPKCPVLHSHRDRSHLPGACPVSLTCPDTAALTLPQKPAGQVGKSRHTEAQQQHKKQAKKNTKN